VTGANAGIHLLAWLPGLAPERVEALVARAEAEGVGLYSIAPYYSTAPERAGLLFGYGNLDERDFDEGVRRVARALEVVGRSAPTTAARRG